MKSLHNIKHRLKSLTKMIFVVGFLIQLNNSKTYYQSILFLQKKGSTQELIIDGKPYLVLGGEPGNSTAFSFNLCICVLPGRNISNLTS